MMTDNEELMREEKPSALPFWLMMAVLLLWQGAVSILPQLKPEQVVMTGAGFCLAAMVTFSGAIDPRRHGAGFCAAVLSGYTLWYVSRTVSHVAMVWGGLRIYDGVAAVESLCDAVTLEPIWVWVVITFAGLGKSGKLKVTPLRAVLAALVLLTVSSVALIYIMGTPAGQLDFADTYIISRLCAQWLYRFGMLCALWAWCNGRVGGAAVWAVFAIPSLLTCGIYALCAAGFGATAVFWANAAVCVTFALVGIEYTFMKGRSEAP